MSAPTRIVDKLRNYAYEQEGYGGAVNDILRHDPNNEVLELPESGGPYVIAYTPVD